MSADNDLWHALYIDAVRDVVKVRDEANDYRCRLIYCESQRRTLFAMLDLALNDLELKHAAFAALCRQQLNQMRSSYVEKIPIQSSRTTARDSQPDTGSASPLLPLPTLP